MLLISMMMNILFLNSSNPLFMGFTLILQTMIISLIIGKMNYTFWFSYVIFLIFIGGMLILFMYVISLINNNKWMFMNYKIMMIMLMLLIFYYLNFKFNFLMMNTEMMKFNYLQLNNENSMNLLKLFNFPNLFINMILIIYLFLMMIISTKISNFNMGPFFKF